MVEGAGVGAPGDLPESPPVKLAGEAWVLSGGGLVLRRPPVGGRLRKIHG